MGLPETQAYFVEIAVRDPKRTIDFYTKVFGWESFPVEGPIDYHLAGEADGPALVGFMPNAAGPQTLIYFPTDDLAGTLDRIREHGGQVITEQPVEGLGRVAQWKDPQGNTFGLTEPSHEDAPLLKIDKATVSEYRAGAKSSAR